MTILDMTKKYWKHISIGSLVVFGIWLAFDGGGQAIWNKVLTTITITDTGNQQLEDAQKL